MHAVLSDLGNAKLQKKVAKEVAALCKKHPIYR
jgi:hypothetical protein